MRSHHTSAPSRRTLASAAPSNPRRERGAVLVQMAIAMVGLISFSALVIDYGVLWASRRQAQNAADAGAMAAAVSLAFVDFDNHPLAQTAAVNTARTNFIWGEVPDITTADVTFPPCPPGSPIPSSNACVRVDVYRNQRANGNPLPTIFGRLIGVTDQGVKATATAQVLWGDSADCVKPWAIPDKWIEHNPNNDPWDPTDEFNAYDSHSGTPLPNADFYQPPGTSAVNNGAGTGFTRESIGLNGSDYGLEITLKDGNSHNAIAPGWYYPVVVDPSCVGGNCYSDSIAGCSPVILGPGSTLSNEPGNMIGPTKHGVEDLIALDPGASWDTSAYGGKGGIVGGCQSATPACVKSPRLVAVPVFDVDAYDAGKASGRQDIVIVKILGFFIDHMDGNDVVGHLCYYPGPPRVNPNGTNVQAASFVVSLALVR